MTARKQYRQGDVLIERMSKEEFKSATFKSKVNPERGRLIVARGEATGHHHALVGDSAEMFERAGRLFIRIVGKPADLVHEEHATESIPPGHYQVVNQREYEEKAAPRRVYD